ncbi:MAG: replicative DNA helicase [Coxiella sp. (in: Bacteria)]|nr:MAG: replicative DNA helicase [Coxiella sp. (in: g-proteobacteria)]
MMANTQLAPKVPPYSEEAECAVLGALMIDNRSWDNVSDKVYVSDFYRHEHRLIFTAITQLAERQQPFDVLTITEHLRSQNTLDQLGGETFLFELAQNTPSASNATAYATIVRERSVLRQLISTGTDIADSAFNADGKETKELLDAAEQLVFQIAEQGSRGTGPVKVSDLLAAATQRIDDIYHSTDAFTGISTGFSELDEMTSGFQRGDMIVIAGRPSMGKTTFAMNIAEYAAIKGDKPVLIFSLEMPAEQLTMRMISSLGRIDQHNLRTGNLKDEDWPRISSAVSMLSEAKMYIDDTPALSPMEIRARARRVSRANGGLGMIIIDYLQLMQIPSSKENRTNEISEISRSLKALAKELDVPVVALSQLNRGLESRTDKRPVMSDLRESGAIEQDADVIAFIYRDEVYNDDSPDKGTAEIIIRKQRNGPIGDFRLTFMGQFTRFENFIPSVVTSGEFV